MNIRALGGEDTERYIALYRDGVTRFPNAFLRSLAEVRDAPAAQTARVLGAGNIFGAFEGDDLVGIAGLSPFAFSAIQHRALVGPFYVNPTYQGAGCAAALMDELVAHARAIEVVQLELFVWAENPRAIAFYQRCGFAQCGVVPNAVRLDGTAHDDLFMVRPLHR